MIVLLLILGKTHKKEFILKSITLVLLLFESS